jgi:hypothetical protein
MTASHLETIQENYLELLSHQVELKLLLSNLDFIHMSLTEDMITSKLSRMMALRNKLLELRNKILKLLFPHHSALLLVLIPQLQASHAEEEELPQEA